MISTDVENNIIYVGQGQNHHGLFRKALFIDSSEVHWVRPDMALKQGEQKELSLRIRYRQPLQKGKLINTETGLYLLFDEAQRGVTAGQFASWYEGDELVGSGVIA